MKAVQCATLGQKKRIPRSAAQYAMAAHPGNAPERWRPASSMPLDAYFERGLAGASVDEIARLARAGKPTIYA